MTAHTNFEPLPEAPELRGRMLVGRIFDADASDSTHIVFEFADDDGPLQGTFRGGPILFGTFVARWRAGDLLVTWKCQHRTGFAEGQTLAAVEVACGGRIRVKERWIEQGDERRPGFLYLEEPMCDCQS